MRGAVLLCLNCISIHWILRPQHRVPSWKNDQSKFWIGRASSVAALGCLPPGQTSLLPPHPTIRSAIDILMVTTIALVWTVNSKISWGWIRPAMQTPIRQKQSNFRIPCPSKCRPLHSAARGGCSPLYPLSHRHWASWRTSVGHRPVWDNGSRVVVSVVKVEWRMCVYAVSCVLTTSVAWP